jgi:hypothetical protein
MEPEASTGSEGKAGRRPRPQPPHDHNRARRSPMNGMTVYDIVQIERKLALKGANRRLGPKVDAEPRRRLWRRRLER